MIRPPRTLIEFDYWFPIIINRHRDFEERQKGLWFAFDWNSTRQQYDYWARYARTNDPIKWDDPEFIEALVEIAEYYGIPHNLYPREVQSLDHLTHEYKELFT